VRAISTLQHSGILIRKA